MKNRTVFSLTRWWSIVLKEFLQLRRDRVTFGMMIGVPLLQLVLFGFAINSDPKHLPTAVLVADQSIFSRDFVTALENSGYFRITHRTDVTSSAESVTFASSAEDIHTAVTDWLRDFLDGQSR